MRAEDERKQIYLNQSSEGRVRRVAQREILSILGGINDTKRDKRDAHVMSFILDLSY